jgi:glycosyltransferase involved in cell wall biosynthesis
MKKKNLLIATDCFLPRWDGVARFLLELMPYLKKEYDITVLAPKFEGKLHGVNGIKLIRFKVGVLGLGDYKAAFPNKKIIKQEVKKADIVFTQTIGPIGKATIEISKKLRKKVIAYTHSIEWELVHYSSNYLLISWILSRIARYVAKKMYNRCDKLLVPSEEIAEIMEWHGIRTNKVIVPLGTNTKQFAPPKSKEDAKEKINIDPKKTVIGFTGRLGREKDIPTLYRAFRRLEKRHPNIALLIVGKGVTELKRMLTRRENIILVEFTNDVVKYLQAMDIYVLPSLTETTSIATLEAMSTELPVVVTKVGSIPGYVKNNYNGIFFQKRNPYFLEKKLDKLISNPEIRKKIGENARKTVVENFSWENTHNKIKKEFDKV